MERKRIEYRVCRKGDRWVIMFSGRPFGAYPNLESALRQAQGSANFLRAQGHDVELKVQSESQCCSAGERSLFRGLV